MSKKVEDKRFSRGEVELIVRRAAELQQAPSDERIAAGASLAEIEALAGQLGIAPDNVRAAALELHRPKRASLAERVWGAPTRLRLVRTSTRAHAKETFERLVIVIQRELDDTGSVAAVGNTLIWSSTAQRAPVRRSITISTSEEGTTATLEIQSGQLAGGLFGGIGGGFGGGAGSNALAWAIIRHSPTLGALTAAIFAGAYLVPRFIFTRVMNAQVRRGEALLDQLVAELER